jgi:hypothetical protein
VENADPPIRFLAKAQRAQSFLDNGGMIPHAGLTSKFPPRKRLGAYEMERGAAEVNRRTVAIPLQRKNGSIVLRNEVGVRRRLPLRSWGCILACA